MFRMSSKMDAVYSYPSGNIKTYAISEASSVLPAFSVSAFSLDVNDSDDFHSSTPDLFGLPNRFDEGLSSSCKEGLDVFDNPEYTDTVKSTDSTGSILRRSLSLPRQYTYREQLRKNVREVFEDFIVSKDGKNSTAEEDEEEKKEWRQTMEDLLERPDYIDSLQSTSSGTALLAKTATIITKAGQQTKLITEERNTEIRRKKIQARLYIKNLIVLSMTGFFLFGAYLSLRNLQSSINADTSLAFYSLSLLYLCFFLGCILATSIIQYLRPKRTMILAHFIVLIYVATNFYPTYFTLLPASLLQGFGLATFWTAHSTYLASIGISYAQLTGKNPVAILTKFNGIFFTFFGCSQVLGNLISSTVLMVQMHISGDNGKSQDDLLHALISNDSVYMHDLSAASNTSELISINATMAVTPILPVGGLAQCGAQYAPEDSTGSGTAIDPHVVYIILSIFGAMMSTALLIVTLFLDPLEGQIKTSKSLCTQLAAVFRWFMDFRATCLIGLMVYSLLQMAFIFGEFTKSFVTCPFGVQMVGYAMLTMSASSSASSFLSGKMVKYIGRPTLMLAACALHLGQLMLMLVWTPREGRLAELFIFMGFWGIADGIFITQIVSIVGALFVDNKEPAFAGVKMCQSLGACLCLATAKYISFQIKICIIIGLLVIATATYLVLEVALWRQIVAKRAPKVKAGKMKETNLNGPTRV